MSKPDPLRLAEQLEAIGLCGPVAAELRRLSGENERLRQIVEDFPPVEAELHEVSDRAHRLEQQRDALLEALKEAVEVCIWPNQRISDAFDKAKAAIKAVEGEKK